MAARKNDVNPKDATKKAKKNIFSRAGKAIAGFFKNIYSCLLYIRSLKRLPGPQRSSFLQVRFRYLLFVWW